MLNIFVLFAHIFPVSFFNIPTSGFIQQTLPFFKDERKITHKIASKCVRREKDSKCDFADNIRFSFGTQIQIVVYLMVKWKPLNLVQKSLHSISGFLFYVVENMLSLKLNTI